MAAASARSQTARSASRWSPWLRPRRDIESLRWPEPSFGRLARTRGPRSGGVSRTGATDCYKTPMADFSTEAVERGRRYHRPRYLSMLLELAVAVAALCLLAFTDVGDALLP